MRTFRAPGRINLIGEHTDYNGGLVMPVAIDRETRVSLTPRDDRTIRVESRVVQQEFEFDAADPGPPHSDWTDYLRGVAVMLIRSGINLCGAELVIESDVPLGAGLSSSASLEVAVAHALLANSAASLPPYEIALLCQRAENEFVGVRCGIMDQYAGSCAEAGTALMLDCGTLRSRYLPWPSGISLVICNTMVKHDLAASAYNQRRAECEAAASLLAVTSLSEVTLTDLRARSARLPEPLIRRARHVVTENARVAAVADALENSDLAALGPLLASSHSSLRDDYEVSCPELDLMVGIAGPLPGLVGSRMTGGGFGGCTINLVEQDEVESFRSEVAAAYQANTGITPEVYVCASAAGAEEITTA